MLKTCPNCNNKEIIPILYGQPTLEKVAKCERGEVVLGGCVIVDGMPKWHCKKCGHRFL
jgi:hypothetical protein